jgi:sulfur relay (sulfurtransferase) DsrF/TusC family protein
MLLALIVRTRPHRHRETRAELDFALAAAAMDCKVEVYFMSGALLQLASVMDSAKALLPGGYPAWAAVPDLSETRFYADESSLQRFRDDGLKWIHPVEALDADTMRQRWRRCDRVVVI